MSRLIRVLLTPCALVSLAACSDAVTAPPNSADESNPVVFTASGRIAFVSSRGGRGSWPDIYLASPDGSEVTRLTTGRAPAWSPDARHVAFFRPANPYDHYGIYIIGADGNGERFLTVGASPAWGPDGRIAFSNGAVLSGGTIMVINADGTGLHRLLPQGWALANWTHWEDGMPCGDNWMAPYVDQPAWSPDARTLAFVLGCDGAGSLYLIDADGSTPRLLHAGYARAPAWSPDGTRIALHVDGTISTIDVGTGELVVHYAGGHGGRDARLAWSPDGSRLLFQAGDYDRQRIFALTLGTGEVRQLIAGEDPDYYSDFEVASAR
jgi:Tol biopolymer transport system component